MAVALYKPGQGYWVRVLFASLLGLFFLASAAWLMEEVKTVATHLPPAGYSFTVKDVTAEPAAGTPVSLLGERVSGEEPVLGSAVVESYDTNTGVLVVTKPVVAQGKDVSATSTIRGDVAPLFRASAIERIEVPMIEPMYVQAFFACLVILIGAVVTYWLCAVKPKTVDFLIATDMEMRKVNWSTRHDIIASTWVVIGCCFLIAALIFTVDAGLQILFTAIGVIKT